jgi:hypothetical protein
MKIERVSDNTISIEREIDIVFKSTYEFIFYDTLKIKTFYKKENEIWKLKYIKERLYDKISNKYHFKKRNIDIITQKERIEINNYVLNDIVIGINFKDINWIKKVVRDNKIENILK